jgi:hypothetical protein
MEPLLTTGSGCDIPPFEREVAVNVCEGSVVSVDVVEVEFNSCECILEFVWCSSATLPLCHVRALAWIDVTCNISCGLRADPAPAALQVNAIGLIHPCTPCRGHQLLHRS